MDVMLAQAPAPEVVGSTAELVVFCVTALIALVTGLNVIVLRNAVHAALMLVINFFAIAVLYALLEAQFLAVVQIIVDAGAIMVLFVFVIMLLNLRRGDEAEGGGRVQRFLYLPVALLLAGGLMYALLHHRLPPPGSAVPGGAPDFGTVEAVGRGLFTEHLVAFEAASVLLGGGMIGAVGLAKARLG